MFNCSGILFNHESELRKEGYLFHELAIQINRLESRVQNYIAIRNPDFLGDWHSATDTIKGLELMARSDVVDDLVLASGVLMSVRDIIELYATEYLDGLIPNIIATSPKHKVHNETSLVGNPKMAESIGWTCDNKIVEILRELVLKLK